METNETRKLTKAAIEEYQVKLDDMKTNKRTEIAEQIKIARDFGDISENAEYDAAMDAQAKLEYDIQQLEEVLANAEIIEESGIDTTTVNIGTRVMLFSKEAGIEEMFDFVSTSESAPFSKKVIVEVGASELNKERGFKQGDRLEYIMPSKLSDDSPVGKAIMGKKEGTTVNVMLADGAAKYKVISIARSEELPSGRIIFEEILTI